LPRLPTLPTLQEFLLQRRLLLRSRQAATQHRQD
jgi:hypothetical protein